MCLAALVDAGVPLAYLQEQLASLKMGDEFTLSVTPTQRQGLRALYAQVDLRPFPGKNGQELAASSGTAIASRPNQVLLDSHRHLHRHGSSYPGIDDNGHNHDHSHPPLATPDRADPLPHRNFSAIERLITQADLPDRVCRWSLAVFRCLAEAEAAVHGVAVDQVHFHEVGATDAIVDIVGTCLGLDYLGIDTLVCSPLPTGRGRVRAAHGWLPVPAPAVLKLLEHRQVPIYSNGLDGELVTPTGAAIAIALANSFGDPPVMTLQRTGLGAGKKDLPVPNMLRLWVGTAAPEPAQRAPVSTQDSDGGPIPYDRDTVMLLETQVDDMVPQAVGYLCDRLLEIGALDVFTQPSGMKKSRPGLLITVICRPRDEARCVEVLFAETPTLGIRRHTQQRWILPRLLKTLQTPYGPIAVKLAYHPQTHVLLNVHPEYEDCAALARQHHLPWHTIYQAALNIWYDQHPQPAQLPLSQD